MNIREHTSMKINLLSQVLDRLLKDGKQMENMKTSKAMSYPFFL